jgi:parallel beta helix pectate lyase-like protein/thrombospondin type 3 repeat protein
MSLKKRVVIFIFMISACLLLKSEVRAGGLNIPADADGGKICKVTSMVDDDKISGSLRRAINQGYNVTDSALPHFCTEKIVFDAPGTISLKQPLVLDNKATSGFTLEKAAGVTGPVILDATGVGEGKCAIVIDSNQVTIRNITIRNASGGGVCIKGGSNGNIIDNVTVTRSSNGVVIESGSQNNLIQNGFFFDNTESGVKLADATQNKVTKNALYRNQIPIISPATDIQATISSAAPSNSAGTSYTLSGTVPNSVDHCEIFRGAPSGSETNYISDVTDFSALSFLATIDARSGEDIFLVCIAPDGTTSPASTTVRLSTVGTGTGSGPRPCFPGQVFPPTADFDGDGIYDINEDKNANCVVDPGETDPTNKDTDGDGIDDGIEDRNKNGIVDPEESDPTKMDTDGDFIPDGVEDLNHNGLRDSSELDPTKKDTDGDGITDDREDLNRNGIKDPDETDGTLVDTDFDGVPDGIEDANHDGIWDPIRESDPRKSDTDGDGLLDGSDLCPNNKSTSCKTPCIPGVIPDDTVDNDSDGIPDKFEDLNNDCKLDPGETDPFNKDTDGDGKIDKIDACPNDPDPTCKGVCDPQNINPFLDSDGDGLKNSEEDKNGNCLVDPGETDAFNPDSDGDGITDGNDQCPLDKNPLCANECKPGVPPPADQDSDGDGIPDAFEDINQNCIQDVNETDFRNRDTDGDGINDNEDPCPLNADAACVKECIPGEFIPPQRDSDKDGIKDVLEDTNKNCIKDVNETDAYNADTDGDGLPDGVEDKNQNGIVDPDETDPRIADTDGDGIPDGTEDKNHNGKVDFDELNPLSQDTDGDGITDFNEDKNLNGIVDKGETNGARKDTDLDGLDDGVEDKNHNGIVDAGETDPRNPDTDGDGVTDGQEVIQGTNPINASTSDFNKAIGKGCSLGMASVPSQAPFAILGVLSFILVGLRIRRTDK